MQLRPLTDQYTHSQILRLTDEGKHLTINALFTQFGLTVQEKRKSFRPESSRAKRIRWQETVQHLIPTTLAPNLRTTQSGLTYRNIIIINQPTNLTAFCLSSDNI